MSVYKKLMDARIKLQAAPLKKSGENKYAGYKYFELGDFLPTVQTIFSELGLCGVVTYGTEIAELVIVDTDSGEAITIRTPMSSAALKGCHEVQNLGAVQTYLRRYLWVTAMEIVEHDALDSSEPLKEKTEPKKDAWGEAKKAPAKKAEFKKEDPKPEAALPEGNGGAWNIKITEDHDGQGWPAAAKAGAEMALELASSADDVLQIFKTNRVIFEKLQSENPAMYDELMAVFKKTKESFAA